MIRDQIRRFGCGMNYAKTGAAIKHCLANGLDYGIYRLGRRRIKKMIQRRHGIELNIEGKNLDEITRDAQLIDLGY
jgi:hypothetical protein